MLKKAPKDHKGYQVLLLVVEYFIDISWNFNNGLKERIPEHTVRNTEVLSLAFALILVHTDFVAMQIHDPLHGSGDLRMHVTARLKTLKQVAEETYNDVHIYHDKLNEEDKGSLF